MISKPLVTMESSQSQQQIVVPDVSFHSYRTTSVISSYGRRQSMVIGILLMIAGALSMIFSSIDLANVILHRPYYPSYTASNAILCGVMVSILLIDSFNQLIS